LIRWKLKSTNYYNNKNIIFWKNNLFSTFGHSYIIIISSWNSSWTSYRFLFFHVKVKFYSFIHICIMYILYTRVLWNDYRHELSLQNRLPRGPYKRKIENSICGRQRVEFCQIKRFDSGKRLHGCNTVVLQK